MADLIHDRSRVGAVGHSGKLARQTVEWLRIFLARFAIVPSSHDLSLKWAEVMVAARRAGRRPETADAWIAATALLYDAALVTHNSSDYLGVPGLRMISENL
jgi:predicted nucleic acid-binding protein